jgi:hypothetical protein
VHHHGEDQRADPLERYFVSKAIVLGVSLVIVVAYCFSTQRTDPADLPGVALDSPFLLDMERAAFAAAFVAGAAVFLVRGWAGHFPSKFSTSGAEYGDWSRVDDVSGSSEDVREEVAELWASQAGITITMQTALDDLASEVRALDERLSVTSSRQDDML